MGKRPKRNVRERTTQELHDFLLQGISLGYVTIPERQRLAALLKHNISAAEYARHLQRANRIIGWMMPYIGSMCPPTNGLFDLNEHCMENRIPEPGKETKGSPIRQRREGMR